MSYGPDLQDLFRRAASYVDRILEIRHNLLAHGLIRASFVPDTQTQELRTLLRTRKQLVREKSSHILRVQKTLEDANIKLDSVITDVMGMSGRAMIEALIAGESNPAKLANLANYRLKVSQEKLREALRGGYYPSKLTAPVSAIACATGSTSSPTRLPALAIQSEGSFGSKPAVVGAFASGLSSV